MKITPDCNSLGFLLNDAARLLRKRFDQKARHLGLTRAQWQALAHLALHEGVNQACLADLMDVEPITLCRLIDRMEEGGWVERRPDPNDRRARLLYMTDKAYPVLNKMRDIAHEVYDEALAGMPPETRDFLRAALSHVRTNLSERSTDTGQAPAVAGS